MIVDEYTVPQIAERLGKTEGRVRQLCRKMSLGKLISKNLRLLNSRDVKKLEHWIDSHGRDFQKT